MQTFCDKLEKPIKITDRIWSFEQKLNFYWRIVVIKNCEIDKYRRPEQISYKTISKQNAMIADTINCIQKSPGTNK